VIAPTAKPFGRAVVPLDWPATMTILLSAEG